MQQPNKFQIGNVSYFVWLPSIGDTPSKKLTCIFFGHATGVPSLAYKTLFSALVDKLGVAIVSYDVPGFGGSKDAAAGMNWRKNLWLELADAHCKRWRAAESWLKKETNVSDNLDWIFVGHSIGAWLSIWAAASLGLTKVIALDLVWLPRKMAFLWGLAATLGLRSKHPVGRKSVTRRRSFASNKEAATLLARKSLFRGWGEKAMEDYVDSLFFETEQSAVLTHNPQLEAALFYSQPVAMSPIFKAIPEANRVKVELLFVAGSKSVTCDYRRFGKLKRIFPAATCVVLQDREHMFPLSDHENTVRVIENYIKTHS